MDVAQQYTLAGFAIIGLVNGMNLFLEKEWKSFAKWLIAVIAGTGFGFLHWFMLPSAEVGFIVGLASSGLYKVVQIASK